MTLYNLFSSLDLEHLFTTFNVESTSENTKDSADISLATCGGLQHYSDSDSHDTSSISSRSHHSAEPEKVYYLEMSPTIRCVSSLAKHLHYQCLD